MSGTEPPYESPMPVPATQGTDADMPPQQPASPSARLLVILAMLYTLYFTAPILVPLLAALLLSLMLAPVVRWLHSTGLPRSLAAASAVLTIILLSAALIISLAGPAKAWIAKTPQAITRIDRVIQEYRKPFAAASKASDRIAELGSDQVPAGKTQIVRTAEPGALGQWLSEVPMSVLNTIGVLFLTVLFLTHGDSVLRKLVRLAPQLKIKKDIVDATRSAQRELSRYIVTVTLVNLAFGGAVALALWLLGVEQPLMWGGIAAIVNYAPYLGMAIMIGLLTVVGFVQFDTPGMALSVPGAYIVLNLIESEIITPHVIGRSMQIDPLVVILALLVLGWMWGLVGILIAVPVLTCFKIIAEKIPGLSPVAQLIGHEKSS
ncbi:MAG TPA: AI-2E family transporter [Arenimonas sp.]|nr:AI-2E family transporter [Arenimonas sp.]